MNNNLRKLLVLLIIAVFLVLVIYANIENNDYSIPFVVKNISISNDGTTHINEDINYTFSGKLNNVHRTIPFSDNQSISNISVETPGFYNKLEVENSSEQVKISVSLYKDKDLTEKAYSDNARVIYHYNFNKKLKMYNDIAEFQYTVWGPEYEKGVYKLQTHVTLPGNYTNVGIWNNPPYKVVDLSLVTLATYETNYKIINRGETVEQRILIPKEYFKSTTNMEVINQDAKADIEETQREYYDLLNRNIIISYILIAVAVILIASPAVIYYKWIREPNTSYDKKYETEIPTKDNPLFVNALVKGDIGIVDKDGFYATILHLMDKNSIQVQICGDETLLKLNRKDSSTLEDYEKRIMEYLSKFGDEEDRISLESIKNSNSFQKFFEDWKNTAENTLDYSQYFHSKGAYYSLIYGTITVLFIIISVILMIFVFIPYVPIEEWIFRAVIALIPESIIMLALHKTIRGQWSKKGKEFYDKWKSFEYYLNDYNLIKEYPPESEKLWSTYLVYATALGDFNIVNKAMKKYFEENIEVNTLLSSQIEFYVSACTLFD